MAGCRMGRWSPNLESEIHKLSNWGRRRFRVALLPIENPASLEPGLRLNPQPRRIPAEMRAEPKSAEIAISGSDSDDELRSAALRHYEHHRQKRAGRALFDGDATP